MLGKECSLLPPTPFFFFFIFLRRMLVLFLNSTSFLSGSQEISRASPSQPTLPFICCWALWDEVIKRKFLFSCICFPTQPCCFIIFTTEGMCFKSDDLYYVRKSSHSTGLSKHCLLTYGNKIIPVAPCWPLERGWHLCVVATSSGRWGQLSPLPVSRAKQTTTK